MEHQEEKSFESNEVPIRKTLKDNCYFNKDNQYSHVGSGFSPSPQKDDIKIRIKCGKIVEHHTESNRCVQAVEYCNNEGPPFDQIGMDTDAHPDLAVKDIEIDVPDTTISATLPDGSTFTDGGEEATIKDLSSSNVSRLSTSKVSPTWEKNDLKIKIKCGKIVQSSIGIDKVEKVEKVIEGSKVSAQIGMNTESSERGVNEIESEIKVNGTSANITMSSVGASVESQKDSSDVWNFNKPSLGWKKKTESRCGMPRVEQDSTPRDLLPPLKINPSLSIEIGGSKKSKSPTLRGSSFQEAPDKVLPDGRCGMESKIGKIKISQMKRKSSKSIQHKPSDKSRNKMTKRKTRKSLGLKLNRTLLIVRRTCRKCLKKSSTFSMNINHEQLEHPHICQICTDGLFSFIDKKDLKRHKEMMHSVDTFEVAEKKNLDSKAFEKDHMTRNFDDNAAMVAKMPKVLEQKSIGPKVMKEADIKMDPLRNSNDSRSGNTFNQNIIKDDLSSKQTEQEENFSVKPEKQVDFNKNETLPDDDILKIIPLNNLIETGTYLVTKPTANENGTSWKMEKIEECAKSADALSVRAAAVINAGPIKNSDDSQTQTTHLTGSIPATLAMISSRETSPSVKVETSSSAAIPKSVAIGMQGVNMSNSMSGGNARVMRGNTRARMIQPPMRGNMRIGMMQPPLRGNLRARMIPPPLRGGEGVKIRGGSAVPIIRGMRPRMQMGRGVVGIQGIRPLGVSGAHLRSLGVRGAHLGPSGVRGSPLRPPSVPGAPCTPQLLLRGRGGVGMRGVPGTPFLGGMRPQIKRKSGVPIGARPLGVQIGPRVPQPGYPKQIPAQRASMGPMVPDEHANLPTAFQPKIVKVETVNLSDLPTAFQPKIVKVETVNLSDEEFPSVSVNSVLDHLMSRGISVTRNKTSTIPKSLEIPAGISLTPVSSFYSQSRRNGFSRDEVADSSYSITPVLKESS